MVESLTHASLMDWQVPCYQCLKFLGNSVLDPMVVQYLYLEYSKADPGKITELKEMCVKNNVLSMICLELNLHKRIIH
jgi:dsRNA-specific ribonuclease